MSEQLNACLHCQKRGPYTIIRTQDSWLAECRNCRKFIDIGNPPIRGYA